MNILPLRTLVQRPRRSAVFRFPRQMHVPANDAALRFALDPQISWLGRSFSCWFKPESLVVPRWIRDADAA